MNVGHAANKKQEHSEMRPKEKETCRAFEGSAQEKGKFNIQNIGKGGFVREGLG